MRFALYDIMGYVVYGPIAGIYGHSETMIEGKDGIMVCEGGTMC